MNSAVIIAGVIAVGVLGIVLGIFMGSLLGKIGCIQFLSFILRIPKILISSPKTLKSKFKMWHELKESRKIERQKLDKKIKSLEKEIQNREKEIKKIKTQIRRIKWESLEPK